jgi:hypothetical protein
VTQTPSLVKLFVVPLNRAGIQYMVTGGLAAVVYGHPRLTLDIDLVVRLATHEVVRFGELWDPSEFYCPPTEAIAAESARAAHGHFNVIHLDSAMRADVYVAPDEAISNWALQHRRARMVEGEAVQFAPIEYVIAYKLRYFQLGGSERHLRDVARMLEVSNSEIDQGVLHRWIAELDLDDAWERARSFGAAADS